MPKMAPVNGPRGENGAGTRQGPSTALAAGAGAGAAEAEPNIGTKSWQAASEAGSADVEGWELVGRKQKGSGRGNGTSPNAESPPRATSAARGRGGGALPQARRLCRKSHIQAHNWTEGPIDNTYSGYT